MNPLTPSDIGRIVLVHLVDHGENVKEPPLIEVVGRVVAVSAGEIRLRSWGPVTQKGLTDATTDYSIVPACVRRVRRLTK